MLYQMISTTCQNSKICLVFMACPVHVIYYLDKIIMLIYMLFCNKLNSDHNHVNIYGSIKIGDEIFVREKEYVKGTFVVKVVQFVGGG